MFQPASTPQMSQATQIPHLGNNSDGGLVLPNSGVTNLTRNPDLVQTNPEVSLVFEKNENVPGANSETNSLCLTDWASITWNFRQDKDFDSLNGQLLVMPVRYGRNNHKPQYETLSHHYIKELRQAIKDSGLASPYFNNVVKSILILRTLFQWIVVTW